MNTQEGTSMGEGAEAQEGVAAPQDADMGAQQPSEEEMRAAYEAELSRISSADMILQAAASLLNIGGLRLGLAPDSTVERDLEQVRDAIDAVRALLPILERHGRVGPPNLGPLRDALSQLQMAYAREAQAAGPPGAAPGAGSSSDAPQGAGVGGATPAGGAQQPAGPPPKQPPASKQSEDSPRPEGPGPAESSGRLWVPGR